MKRHWWVLGAALAVAAVGYGTDRYGMDQGMKMGAPATPPGAVPSTERKVLYWHDPMVPGQRFDKPGKSPFMDMQLVPVYADEASDEGGVAISPRVQQNLGIRFGAATTEAWTPTVEAVGTVAYNEREVALVQARASGFVEKLHVRATLDRVSRGQPLLDLYVPEWVAAQEEYLGLARIKAPDMESLRAGALQRMRLAGMEPAQIDRVVASGTPHPRMTLTAPIAGVVAELQAREGMAVALGAPLFRINGTATVWMNAEVPEAIASQVRPGVVVEAKTAALAGRAFKGKVSAILPEVNPATRTIKARIELDNPRGELVPGMFATVRFTPASGREVVAVPSEAVIRTGTRNVVIVAQQGEGDQPRFAPTEVEIGSDFDGKTEIRKGLAAGTKVVLSGQFLIDSEASFRTTEARLAGASKPFAATHRAEGKVEALSPEAITISHGPVPELKWPAMTMEFQLPKAGIEPPAVGASVEFEFVSTAGGEYRIESIRPRAPAPGKGKP